MMWAIVNSRISGNCPIFSSRKLSLSNQPTLYSHSTPSPLNLPYIPSISTLVFLSLPSALRIQTTFSRLPPIAWHSYHEAKWTRESSHSGKPIVLDLLAEFRTCFTQSLNQTMISFWETLYFINLLHQLPRYKRGWLVSWMLFRKQLQIENNLLFNNLFKGELKSC